MCIYYINCKPEMYVHYTVTEKSMFSAFFAFTPHHELSIKIFHILLMMKFISFHFLTELFIFS